ncbi:MAG TPA: hypothetical protein VG797_01760, partial [Phycisphaerales bacterium]|nr:hypothetical protein [Phycisphaerales bacterium]
MNTMTMRVSAVALLVVMGSCDLAPKAGPTSPESARGAGSSGGMGSRGGAPGKSGGGGSKWGGGAVGCAFEPRAVSLHPMTRVVPARVDAHGKVVGERAIDVYVELLDEAGDGVKGMGTLLFELYRGESAAGEQLARWSESIADAEKNSARYDRVSRCYRFELGLEGVDLAGAAGRGGAGARLELRARFT